MDETAGEAVWAVLFMTIAYKAMLCRRVDHRLNPRTEVLMPSPFVYAMQ